MTQREVIDAYFLEHRAKVIDIAAYLDRLDRADPGADDSDFRKSAFLNALAILVDGESHRAQRVLDLLSDHTSADSMPQSAEGSKGAAGAPLPSAKSGGDA